MRYLRYEGGGCVCPISRKEALCNNNDYGQIGNGRQFTSSPMQTGLNQYGLRRSGMQHSGECIMVTCVRYISRTFTEATTQRWTDKSLVSWPMRQSCHKSAFDHSGCDGSGCESVHRDSHPPCLHIQGVGCPLRTLR